MKTKTNITSGQTKNFLELCEASGMTPERYQKFIRTGLLSDLLRCPDPEKVDRESLQQALGLDPFVSIIQVDYDQASANMHWTYQYSWWNKNITFERFPITGQGVATFEAKAFYFGSERISSEEVVRRIEAADQKNPWSVAKLEHLLVYGVGFPDEQRKYPIVALGSSCHVCGFREVPFLDNRGDSGDRIDLIRWDGNWNMPFQFLAVRLLPSDS